MNTNKKGLRNSFVKINNILCNTYYSCGFSEISKNTFSYRTPPVAASKKLNF